MTYRPKPIDFCDHVGHGACADCPDDDHVTIDIDGDTYARLAAAADAAGESVDDVAERALTDDLDVVIGAAVSHAAWASANDSVALADLRNDRDRVVALARRPGGVEVVGEDGKTFRLSIPGEALVCDCDAADEADRLRAALRDLLAAYPRLSSEFSTAEQQRAVRAARAALGGGK